MLRRTLAIFGLLSASPAAAQTCAASGAAIAADGRMLGHLPYGDAPPGDLVEAPAGFGLGRGCTLRRDAIPDLERLLAAAAGDPRVMGQLRGLSCHRSIERQAEVFCKPRPAGETRAISVAPPGHSEHATGYALDFAVRPANGCPDAEACMAATPAFRWLVANAPRFGFEMSFPAGNKQNVKWEPWHWRWVGVRADAPGAARTRFVFARARRDFPASPMVGGIARLSYVAAAPRVDLPVAVPKGKKKRRR